MYFNIFCSVYTHLKVFFLYLMQYQDISLNLKKRSTTCVPMFDTMFTLQKYLLFVRTSVIFDNYMEVLPVNGSTKKHFLAPVQFWLSFHLIEFHQYHQFIWLSSIIISAHLIQFHHTVTSFDSAPSYYLFIWFTSIILSVHLIQSHHTLCSFFGTNETIRPAHTQENNWASTNKGKLIGYGRFL